jgi:hypothetical protein
VFEIIIPNKTDPVQITELVGEMDNTFFVKLQSRAEIAFPKGTKFTIKIVSESATA